MRLSRALQATLSFFCLISTCHGSPLKSDETVFFFPTSASQENNSKWNIKIHHWVFEKEEGTFSRKVTQNIFTEIAEALDVTEEEAHSNLFKQRIKWFLVDNERNKKIHIDFNKQTKILESTSANGHAITSFSLAIDSTPSSWLTYKVHEDKRNFQGKVQLIPEIGLTVISDIDDTIKISNVLDKKELIKNTFLKPYKTTEGMPEYYKKLESKGAFFHYVSASPWQLYPSLKPFMDESYPQGTISLRNFRLKDSSIIKFLQSSEKYKIKQIEDIIQRYPKHDFILIGDSGEHDPEVYAKIYKKFSDTKIRIMIRAVKDSDIREERLHTAFKNIPKDQWILFN
ncbi:MAG: App1 family protein [Cocleimonas sp.]